MATLANANYEEIVPTRAEIDSILKSVSKGKGKAKGRNDNRKELIVKELEKRNIPIKMRDKIMSDLASYLGWERDAES